MIVLKIGNRRLKPFPRNNKKHSEQTGLIRDSIFQTILNFKQIFNQLKKKTKYLIKVNH